MLLPPIQSTGERLLARYPLLKRTARALGWMSAGSLIGSGLSFSATVLVARLVGREAFGELGILQSTTAMFQVFAGAAFGLTASKHVAEFRSSQPARAGHIIAVSGLTAAITGLACGLAILLFANPLASDALSRPEIAPLLRVAAVTVAFGSVNAALSGALSGMEEFRAIAMVNTISGAASFPLILGGALYDGVSGVVAALAAQACLTCTIFILSVRKKARQHGIQIETRGANEWAVLLSFSLPVLLNSLIITPTEWSCNAMLVRSRGYLEMGLYTAALQWRNLLIFAPMMLIQSSLPIFASVRNSHGKSSQEFGRLALLTQSALAITVLPLAVLCMFLSTWILSFYGKGFGAGTGAIAGVTYMAMIYASGAGIQPAIEAGGSMWTVLSLNVAWGAIFASSVRISVARWGAPAIGFSEAAAWALLLTAYGFCFRRLLPGKVIRRVFATMALSTAVLCVYRYAPRPMLPWLALPLAGLVFLLEVALFLSDRTVLSSSLELAITMSKRG